MEPEASQAAQNAADPQGLVPVDQLTVNLKVISPSFTLPLSLPGLPATTTVQQLKERIRLQLHSRPSDPQQRLIYRGRMLNRPEEKLLDLFGEEMIRTSDQQSIHLILPEQLESPSLSSTTTPVRGQSPARQEAINNAHHQYFDSVLQQGARHLSRRMPTVSTTVTTQVGGAQPGMQQGEPHNNHPANPHPTAPHMYRTQHSPAYTAQSLQQMAQRLSREAAWHRAHLHQYDRAGMGLGGLRYNNLPTGAPGMNPPDHGAQRRASPSPHRTNTTESGLSDAEVQNILRGADARQAILTMTTAMQRSTSGASMGPPQSGRATPNQASRTPSGSATSGVFGGVQSNPSLQPATEVYILNSPNGPRGLLMNNHAETYYTPSVRPSATSTGASYGLPNPQQLRRNVTFSSETPTPTVAPQPGLNQDNQADGGQGRVRRRVTVHVNRAGNLHPHQNHAGMVAFIARFWPHFWLALRLGLFVWWFASPNSSWSRWIAVIAIAVSIFVLNTGALDGLADQIWRIICRHMENLIPMVGQEGAQAANRDANQEQNAAAPAQQGPAADNGDANPAAMAARLVGQRRAANANWLLNNVRRAERAGLLFLASIAPGVAERHIANLEAEVERQRREAEAAEEAARRAAEAENGEENGGEAEGAERGGAADGEENGGEAEGAERGGAADGEENSGEAEGAERGDAADGEDRTQVDAGEPTQPPPAESAQRPDLIQV
ncbi:hypothetical protein jhhlp_001805 [Lomentospora prolificans]|uniref:Ubiquitin-like domain-containing protein n=1 Tax=Lomentospora prolificans TaxID=41688 RepID=A0A2N3NGV3_9PEZI|nr:hypothetical protein jhhlp_001805 [Lomentospora prolificans]